ncbi:MAG TPA: BON domain-containing protein [Candidatus Binataceae bacterium]|nr:BON domain-containing protein [Candidatus Binataceae bacterium]
MKICPRCGKTYPEAERFCETDGTALVSSASAARQTVATPDASAETGGGGTCPECGGRAEPGETICNYCGTRLALDTGGTVPSAGSGNSGLAAQGRGLNPEDYAPAHEQTGAFGDTGFGQDPSFGSQPDYEQHSQYGEPRRRVIGTLGYAAAAIVALAAGAGLAVYLTTRHEGPPAPIAQVSPKPSPAAAALPSGPEATLATNMQIRITGPDLAASLQRNVSSAQTVFEANKAGLLDTYKQALADDPSLHDGMVVRLSINPDGKVASGGVITSTAANPSLDAEVVNKMSVWKFPPVSGGRPVNIDYPVVFATNSADMASLGSALNAKLASVGPSEAPEYTSAPMPAPTPAVAALPPTAPATLPPTAPAAPAASARVASHHAHNRHHVEARRKPSLTDEVTAALRANRRTRRVRAYAGSGGVVTLTGKVFDQKDKAYAERIARNVNGVSTVIDDMTVETAQWAINQDRIQQELRNAGLNGVTVRVIGSDAYLDGEVKTKLDKERAVTITMSAAPVHVRGNLIRVVPGNIFGF